MKSPLENLIALGLIERDTSKNDSARYYVSPLVADLLDRELDDGERRRALELGAAALFEIWEGERESQDWQQTMEVRRFALEARYLHALISTTLDLARKIVIDQPSVAKRICEETLSLVQEPNLFLALSEAEMTLGNGAGAVAAIKRALACFDNPFFGGKKGLVYARIKLVFARTLLFQGQIDAARKEISEVTELSSQINDPRLSGELSALSVLINRIP